MRRPASLVTLENANGLRFHSYSSMFLGVTALSIVRVSADGEAMDFLIYFCEHWCQAVTVDSLLVLLDG